jgi:hypothetical protein
MGTNNFNAFKGKLTLLHHIGEHGYCTKNFTFNINIDYILYLYNIAKTAKFFRVISLCLHNWNLKQTFTSQAVTNILEIRY